MIKNLSSLQDKSTMHPACIFLRTARGVVQAVENILTSLADAIAKTKANSS